MPNSKSALRAFIAAATAQFLANGGTITVCKPGKARG
jgi:hypothetical protein